MHLPILEKEYTINSTFSDIFQRARPSALCQIMQDIADEHAVKGGFSRESILQSSNAIWMLSRVRYDLDKPLYPEQKITVKTWHRGTVGPLWYRDFTIYSDNEKIGTATTAWIVVDFDSKRLLKPHEVLPTNAKPIEGMTLPKIPIDKNGEYWGDYTVGYIDLDLNIHLNNVKAVDILTNACELQNRENKFIKSLSINYLAECRDTDVLELYKSYEGENEIKISAIAHEKPRLVMKIILEEVEG